MRTIVLLLALLAAGCAAPGAPDAAAPNAPVADAREEGWSILPTGHKGFEPSVGVTSSGAIFMAGVVPEGLLEASETQNFGGKLLRSLDGGATWELVGDAAREPKLNMDPWMWVDPDTDRIFNAPLNPHCSWLAWSDDDGASWDVNPAVACAPPSHDHQKLVTGPPAQGVLTLGYPNVVYYAYNSLLVTGTTGVLGVPVPTDQRLGTIVATSVDGGRTFGPGTLVHGSGCHRGIVGPPTVAEDGRVYLPHGTCEGVDIMISTDSGASWETVSIDAVGSLDDFAFDPGVAVDAAGTAYLVWPAADALLYLARSTDGGATWSAPERISAPGVNATVFSSIVAGAEGKLAIAYAGTDADPSDWEQRASSFAPPETTWQLYVTLLDGDRATHRRITTDEDPLQRGCVWMRGGQSDCRNLFDFITIVQREGRLYLSYTDGCDACESADESTRSDLVLAVSPDAPLA